MDLFTYLMAKNGHNTHRDLFSYLLGKDNQLPSKYQRLEYIESTGTQYIDTNFIPNQDTRIKVKIMTKDISGMANKTVFGSRESASSKNYSITMGNGSQNSWWTGYGTSNIATSSYALRDTLYEIEKNKNVTILNGSILATSESQTFTCSSNLYLFCMNQGGPKFYSNIELYYCKIWENGVLVRNMIPCKNPSNVVGMYDTVNDVFYTNAGTGKFVTPTTQLSSIQSLNTKLLSQNINDIQNEEETNIDGIQEETNLDDVNEIEDIEQNDEPIENKEIEEEVS